MNKIADNNTEEQIFRAAEEEFLEKGYALTKLSNIAKRAEVNHAMIHYYFRSKQNLFNMVFEKKLSVFSELLSTFDKSRSFAQNLDNMLDAHFNFLKENPKLLSFVMREVTSDKSHLELLKKILEPKLKRVYQTVNSALEKEHKEGRAVNTTAKNLMMDIISLNATTILIFNTWQRAGISTEEEVGLFIQERKKHIKRMILASLNS